MVLKAEHHGEGVPHARHHAHLLHLPRDDTVGGHPEHGQRGALYRFSLDNYDEQNRSLGEQTNLVVSVDDAGSE